MIEGTIMDRTAHRWYRLDNAAKLFPAIKNRKWMSIFRLSVLMDEAVDSKLLQQALDTVIRRMPVFALKMKAGVFWYYLENNNARPLVQKDVQNPCVRFNFKRNRGFLFRVRYFNRRIALEVFHALTDGSGGVAFLKTLTAEYLKLKGCDIPAENGVLNCAEAPHPDEMEDGYSRYANLTAVKSRKESRAYRIRGTREPAHILHIITGLVPADALKAQAMRYGVTVTEYMTGVLIYVLDGMQRREGHRRDPIKVSIPVNMRRYYPTGTLRNFSIVVNPGIEPKYGEYTFEEVLKNVHHFMQYETSEKHANARLARNVKSERNPLVRVAPLILKNFIINMVFRYSGESRFTSTITNLGVVTVPEAMQEHIERFDFMLGPSRFNKVNCAVITFNGTICMNFTRTIAEPDVEREFFTFLVKSGIPVKIESNQENY
jgi:NRPS condensation-like uncharacterized protein